MQRYKVGMRHVIARSKCKDIILVFMVFGGLDQCQRIDRRPRTRQSIRSMANHLPVQLHVVQIRRTRFDSSSSRLLYQDRPIAYILTKSGQCPSRHRPQLLMLPHQSLRFLMSKVIASIRPVLVLTIIKSPCTAVHCHGLTPVLLS